MKRFLLSLLFFCTFSILASAQAIEGIWHTKIGELDFYCIQDSPSELSQSVLLTDDNELLRRLMPSGKAPSSYNVFVARKGSDTVLIDTGKGGDMLKHLQTLGIKPEEIKTVLLTHSHGDHVGGLLKDGEKVFPNAEIRISEKELSFWKSARNKDFCEQVLKRYGQPKFLIPDEKTAVAFPEMVAVDLAGHTPGQIGLLLSFGNDKLFVAADLLHCGAVQFERPDISCRFDDDPKRAAEIRIKTMKRAAESKWIFVATHLPFPSAGIVETEGDAFRFVPASESSFYDFSVKDIDSNDFPLAKLKGKKVMVVNVASKCGLTPQYKELQTLYEKYGGDKFTIIAFPANDFMGQEPGTDAEIKEFCTKNYGVTFPVMSKIAVTGDGMHPLYRWLTEEKYNGVRDVKMEWNFQKFLIDEQGKLVDVIPPREKPDSEKVIRWIER